MEMKELVEGYRNELVERLGKLVSVKSELGPAEENAPFGPGPKAVLEAALEMCKEDGFKTVNLDNYIGYAEMGEGEKLIGIVGHLDVVPAKKILTRWWKKKVLYTEEAFPMIKVLLWQA